MSATLTRVRTFGSIVAEARTLLQDKLPTTGSALRYSDEELFESINGAMAEVRTKRPDLFLRAFGYASLRQTIPYYSAAHDMNTPFPLDLQAYQAFVYYVTGRQELREDTFSEDSRAVTLMNKFTSQLLTVQS
jgi:hypothetical protein